jgi:hypothetical protein
MRAPKHIRRRDLPALPPCHCKHAADQHWLRTGGRTVVPKIGECGVPGCLCREYRPAGAVERIGVRTRSLLLYAERRGAQAVNVPMERLISEDTEEE